KAVGLDQPQLRGGERLPAVRKQELGAAPEDAVAGEAPAVGGQVHELRGDESVEAADDRHHRHHGRDPDDDAEERQPRAKLVAPQSPERGGEELPEAHGSTKRVSPPPTPGPSAFSLSSP